MTATERPSDRELLGEAIDLLCGYAPLAWTLEVNLEHAKEYEKRIVAFLDRARTLDAAPADPVVGVGRSPQSIMMSAHALCPSEITAHTARMRWMADYFMRELVKEQSRGR